MTTRIIILLNVLVAVFFNDQQLGQGILYPGELFYPTQLITHVFIHNPNLVTHLALNMLILFVFGEFLEKLYNHNIFWLYMASGIFAGISHLVFLNAPLVGASGAIYGVIAAVVVLAPNQEIKILYLFPAKLKWFFVGLIGYELVMALFFQGYGVSNVAHLSGALMGGVIALGQKVSIVDQVREAYKRVF